MPGVMTCRRTENPSSNYARCAPSTVMHWKLSTWAYRRDSHALWQCSVPKQPQLGSSTCSRRDLKQISFFSFLFLPFPFLRPKETQEFSEKEENSFLPRNSCHFLPLRAKEKKGRKGKGET